MERAARIKREGQRTDRTSPRRGIPHTIPATRPGRIRAGSGPGDSGKKTWGPHTPEAYGPPRWFSQSPYRRASFIHSACHVPQAERLAKPTQEGDRHGMHTGDMGSVKRPSRDQCEHSLYCRYCPLTLWGPGKLAPLLRLARWEERTFYKSSLFSRVN